MSSDFKEIVEAIANARRGVQRAAYKALVQITLKAEAFAKINARTQLNGRNGRTLSGALFNSIYSTVIKEHGEFVGEVGVRNIPYGAIHEFGSGGLPGGVITPVTAKHLWVKNYMVPPQFKRMTPKEFMAMRIREPERFPIFKTPGSQSITAWYAERKGNHTELKALFFLRDSVKMPERPYLRPAVADATEEYPLAFARFYAGEIS